MHQTIDDTCLTDQCIALLGVGNIRSNAEMPATCQLCLRGLQALSIAPGENDYCASGGSPMATACPRPEEAPVTRMRLPAKLKASRLATVIWLLYLDQGRQIGVFDLKDAGSPG